MAQHVEPMDIDSSVCEFDNKENTCHSNVLPRTPCTEKGYEELDVTELNMKLRYSITPAASPMSKSYTANCLDNRNFEVSDSNIENGNLTRSLHSAMSPDGTVKPQKVIPLQSLPTDQLDSSRNALRSLDSTVKGENGNISVTVSGPNDDEIMSFPSSSSSMAHTPEATTPTKEIPKSDGSPLLHSLKRVLNMFRPSQSPIPPEDENEAAKEVLSPPIVQSPDISAESRQAILASTPLMPHKTKDAIMKRNSPNRESRVFNEDLEKELEWKEESTIIFHHEKISVHKLFGQQSKPTPKIINDVLQQDVQEKLDTSVEFMDVSYNDSITDKTMSEIPDDIKNRSDVIAATESDSEFLDCETTFSKNDSQVSIKSQENNLDEVVESKLSLNATDETLDATVSVKSTDVSINSTETTRASINTSVSEKVHVPGVPGNVKNEDLYEVPYPTSGDHNLLPCKPQFDTNVDNISQKLTLVEPEIVDLDVTKSIASPLAINGQNNILDHGLTNVIEPNSTLIVTNAQPETVNKIAHNITGLGNVGVISQIPLISDPRVLLFNLSHDSIDNEVPQSIVESLGTLPVDIPLPDDDDDIEKIVSLLTEEPNLENNVISNSPIDVIKINDTNLESVNDISLKIDVEQTKTTDYDSLPEVKALLANIGINKDVTFPQQNVALNTTEFISKEQNIIESDVVTTVKNVEVAVNAQDINSAAVNEEIKDMEVLFYANQTKNDSLVADKNVADGKAFIPQVEDIPLKFKETQELSKVTCEDLAVTERKEPQQETTENKCEAPITLTDESVCEQASINDIIITTPVDMKIKEDNVAVAIEIVANDNITTKIETKEVTSVDTVLDKVIVSDSDTVMLLSMSTPIAVTEEIKTQEEENNKSIEEIALDIVNKTIEIATTPFIEDFKLDSELKENHETNAINVIPNVNIVTEINTTDQDITTFKEENNMILTSEETPIVSKYITNQTELDVITNDLATVHLVSSDSNNSVVAETNMLVENDINLDVIKVVNIDVASPIVETTQEEKHLSVALNQVTEMQEENINIRDEEIIVSENNSPFVSVTADSELDSEAKQIDNFEEIENPFKTQTTIEMSPPSSPAIISKGYNFNFDEIDDPFATKTKIRQSPPPGATPNQSFDEMDTSFGKTEVPKRDSIKNRRKLQPEKRKSGSASKKHNSTVGTLSVDLKTPKKVESTQESIVEKTATAPTRALNVTNDNISPSLALPAEQIEHDVSKTKLPEIRDNTFDSHEMVSNIFTKSNALNLTSEIENEETFKIEGVVESETIMNEGNRSSIGTEIKNTSSSENSTYYSAGTSSSELVGSKNVFNLPEIDDINFNPFVTKSKMRQSPLPCLQIEETVAPKPEGVFAPDSTIVIEKNNETTIYVSTPKNDVDSTMIMEQISDTTIDISLPKNEALDSTIVIAQNHDATIDLSSPKSDALDSTIVVAQNHDKTIDISSPKGDAADSTTIIEQNHDTTTVISSPKGDAADLTMIIEKNHDTTIDISSPKGNAPDSTIVVEQNHDTTINVSLPRELSSNVDKISEGKIGTEQEEKDSSNNTSNATCSSKASDDKDNTVREINTEDEDTIEGPFLESEDLNNDDKMSDCEYDMMQFTDIPRQENDDNADAGELFIDAEAFEFLLNQNKSNVVTDSGKESLFLKFDPLFAKRMSSDGVLAALSKVQKRQSTPKKISKLSRDSTFVQKSPVAGPSNLNATCDVDINNQQQDESNDDLKFNVSKPMMVVNPAVNPVVTPRNKSLTPTRANRRSLTFTSPAIAVIDRLLSMSANNSLAGHETTVTEVSREQNEADHALTQLRELLADKEINVYNLRTESKQLKERLANLESQMKSLEAVSEERLKKINELTDRLNEKTRMNNSMATVVEEYERTIASLISEMEQDKKRHAQERIELMRERDEQTAHLASMEVSFSDLHSKYEKSKQMIIGFKTNEETYKKSLKEFEESLTKMQNNYELLKQHATSKLNHANDELQKMNRSHEAEVLKLNAMIKRKELHITSLEETLLQKTKANEELTAICDELINKVG